MKDKSQLQTDFAKKIFNFLKQHLYNFKPETEIKSKIDNHPALKASFYYIICKIARDKL